MKAAIMASKFEVAGRLVTVVPTGSGNVNDTFLAIFRTTFSEERFILQRLNLNVFPSPADVMHNMRLITEHVHTRLESELDDADRIWQLPRVIPTRDGQDYAVDDDGECWRAISLIASATAYDHVRSPEHAHEVGYVLGQFQRLISDVAPERLRDTLPGFHITPTYLDALDEALLTEEGKLRLSSSSSAGWCLRFINERREWCSVLEDAYEAGQIAHRPIHGDPKVANVMIDDMTGKGTSLIDLDTVKPGLVHYDFGDCLRSCCNSLGEETLELGKVVFDLDLCEAIVRGYMSFGREFLTSNEVALQYDSIRLLAFELGVRFFSDYVAGDPYFKTKEEGQNLKRAMVQLRLCESIETREGAIRRILDRCAKG
jgi:Ser/Thr protein kinase RdoA (MazF antagonist)